MPTGGGCANTNYCEKKKRIPAGPGELPRQERQIKHGKYCMHHVKMLLKSYLILDTYDNGMQTTDDLNDLSIARKKRNKKNGLNAKRHLVPP